MSYRHKTFTITGDSADSASTTAVGDAVGGLGQFDWFTITATLTGGTGGAVDAVLQFKTDDVDEWWDWIAFAQVGAATTTKFQVQVGPGDSSALVTVGSCTTAVPAATLAAGTSLGGRPTDRVRLVVVAGSGTSAGATQTVRIHGWRRPK